MATWSQGCPWKKKLTHMRDTTSVLTELTAAINKLDDSIPMTDPSLAIHACVAYVDIPATYNMIQGSLKLVSAAKKDLTGAGSAIPQNKYGAYAFQVGANGTIDVVAATDNGTGYSSAAAALAGLASAPSDHSRLGTLVVAAGGATFTPGTTALTGKATFADASTLSEAMVAALTTSVPQTDI